MLYRLQKSAAGSGSPGGGGEGQEGRGAVARPRASLFVPLTHGDSVQEAAKAAEEEAAEDEVKKPLAPTEARTLHDDADLPRLAAVLPPWHPLATTSRVPRSKKVQLELAS